MDLCPNKKAFQGTNYEAHLAQILPENTLIYSHYMCQGLRLNVEDKIVFEAMKTPLGDFSYIFSHIFPYNLKVVILRGLQLY